MSAASCRAASWFALGPYGGDARAIAADPHNPNHLFLGTADGWIYQSEDGGVSWHRLAQIDKRSDLVIDHILVDADNPRRLIAGAWIISHPDGGVFISDDGGHSWYDQEQMRGQSVRSMTRSISDPKEIVAGTLQGVYRSMDDGVHWTIISPPGSTEIHEVQSVAIAPGDGNVIYAGTWHLPWKTTDGGAHWASIHQGIITDSDVFSIVVNPKDPSIVYASACSGIYKSEDAGGAFAGGVTHNHGIPVSARRTRKLEMDPNDLNTVYAGTTEGLYRSLDAGAQWQLLTAPDVVVNDVYVDPANSNHVLLATDRGGVLRSEDGGTTFQPSNDGFSSRQVMAYSADPDRSADVYVGVVNGKRQGGVFVSHDGGLTWGQESDGLGGRDVFSLLALPDGTKLAGTEHGIFRLNQGSWAESGNVAAEAQKPELARRREHGRYERRDVAREHATSDPINAPVYALARDGDMVFAGTGNGLYKSVDDGSTWRPVTAVAIPDARFLAVEKKLVLVGTLKRLELSMDNGGTWDVVVPPQDLTQIDSVGVDDQGNLWVGGLEGVYYSSDYGMTWARPRNLYLTQVDGIYFDAPSHRVLVTSMNSTFAFAVTVPSMAVTYWDSGWDLRFVRPMGDHLLGASLYNGMVVQPKWVASPFSKQP